MAFISFGSYKFHRGGSNDAVNSRESFITNKRCKGLRRKMGSLDSCASDLPGLNDRHLLIPLRVNLDMGAVIRGQA